MKTITEYRPMIFSEMTAHAERRMTRRRQRKVDAVFVAGYTVAGIFMIWTTGFVPWEWQYWTMFGPLFVAGETAIHGFGLW